MRPGLGTLLVLLSLGAVCASVTVERQEDGRVVLINDALVVEMAGMDGPRPALSRILAPASSEEFVTPRADADFWRVEMLSPGREVQTFASSQFDLGSATANRDGLDLRWRVPLGESEMTVTVTVRVPGNTGRMEWRLAVDNRSEDWAPWWMELVVPGLGIAGQSDVIEGQSRHHVPEERLTGYFFGEQIIFLLTPGTLLIEAEDPEHLQKDWELAVGEELVLRVPPPGMGEAGESYAQPFPLVVEPSAESWWQLAAQSWSARQAWAREVARSGPAQEIRDVRLWLTAMHPLTETPGEVPGRALQGAEAIGVPTGIHWYNWAQQPFMPDLFPPRDGFYEAAREAQARGLAVMPYINVLMHVQNDGAALREIACMPSEPPCCGRIVNGLYDVQVSRWSMTPACRGAAEWVEFCAQQAFRLFDAGGFRMIYLDQAASPPRWPCFNEAHGHPIANGGYWAEGTIAIARRISELTGDAMGISGEGRFEGYLPNVDLDLLGYVGAEEYVPLYEAIYGARTASFGSLQLGDSQDAFVYKAGVRGIYGTAARISTEVVDHPEKVAFLREVLSAQVTLGDLLREGRMVCPPDWAQRPPDYTIAEFQAGKRGGTDALTVPALHRAAWTSARESAVVVLNVSDRPQRAALKLATGPAAQIVSASGEVVAEVPQMDEELEFDVPARSIRILRWENAR